MIFSQTDLLQEKDKFIDESLLKQPLNVTIDEASLRITVDGVPIDYNHQSLTEEGLQIIRSSTDDTFSARILLQPKISMQFDTKYSEANYCQQLAHALDRTSHSAAAIYRKAKLNKNKQFSPSSQYSLEICEYLIKKIPRKARCFENVFANLPIDKILVLFQNDSFFVHVLKLVVFFVFKVDVQQIQNSEQNKQVLTINSKSRQNLQDVQNDSNSTPKKSKSKLKREKNFSSNYNIRVFNLYESLKQNLKTYKLCFERLNLLKKLFSHETRLYTFLNQLNQTIIARQLSQSVPQLHQFSQQNIINSLFPKPNLILDVLNKNIAIIKTVYLSLGRSETASKVIKQAFMENKAFSDWLKSNLQSISFSHDKSMKLIQLFGIFSEICPIFMGGIFQQNQNMIVTIISSQIRIIYQKINSQYQTQSQRKSQLQKSYTTLDTLLRICRLTIKQTSTTINLGRIICKLICETATILRPSDIQLLTYSCCINTHSRQLLIRYLFAYFRRLVRKLKNHISISINNQHRNINVNMNALKQIKKHKHQALEIIQSIRKIAQLDCIDVEIGAEFVQDISLIVAHMQYKNYHQINKQKRGGSEVKDVRQSKKKLESIDKATKIRDSCLTSAFDNMLKKIKLQGTKEKNNNSILADTL